MQVLWEGTDEKTADRNFKVTLNALLKALEPNRKAREPSFFIIRKEKMYQLNPDATIVDEREIFLEASNKGLETIDVDQSIDHLLMAHHLFKDTPFGDMRDVDWLSQERHKLEQKHIQVLERLAQLYLKKSDFLNTIKYSEMILKYDVTWEEAYRLLMLAYYRLQNRPQSIKWYNRCVEVLQKELNIKPMQATVDLYEMILNYDLP